MGSWEQDGHTRNVTLSHATSSMFEIPDQKAVNARTEDERLSEYGHCASIQQQALRDDSLMQFSLCLPATMIMAQRTLSLSARLRPCFHTASSEPSIVRDSSEDEYLACVVHEVNSLQVLDLLSIRAVIHSSV